MSRFKISLVNLVLPEQTGIYPPFGILSIAVALRRKGAIVSVFHERATKQNMEAISEKIRGSLFVGLSVLTGKTINHSLALSKKIKAQGIPVLWGGIHPTFLPGCTLQDENIDYIIMGEGEQSVCDFLECYTEKKDFARIKGLGYKNNGKIVLNDRAELIDDLDNYKINWDDIFIPDYLRFENNSLKFFPYLTSRGCPHRCGFCYNNDFNGRKWRSQGANKVLEDINYLKSKYRIDGIDFMDDNFFTDKQRAFEIIEGIHMPWMAEIRADYVTEEFIRECKKHNCYKLILGCESGSDNVLNLIHKDSSISQVKNTIDICYRHGIKVYCSFMIMLPGERNEDRDQTIRFIKYLMDKYPGIEIDGPKIYTPYPGTSLYRTSKEIGWKEPADLKGWSKYHRSMDPALLGYVKNKDKNKYRVLSAALAVKGDILKKMNTDSSWLLKLYKALLKWRLDKMTSIFPLDLKLYFLSVVLSDKLSFFAAVFRKISVVENRMYKFGESIVLRSNVGLLGKIRFNLLGMVDFGYSLRSSYFRKYLKEEPIKNMIEKKRILTILDVGCGNGDYSYYLAQRYPNSLIYATDINEDILIENRQIQNRLGINNINFLKENLINLNAENKYDFIICIGVITYMTAQENELIFKNIFNSLKKGALIYLYLTRRDWEDSLIINPRFYKKMYGQAKRHNYGCLYDESGLFSLLTKIGFRTIKQKITGGFWGELGWEIDQILKEKKLERIRQLIVPVLKIIGLLDMFMKNRKGTGMIFILEKGKDGIS